MDEKLLSLDEIKDIELNILKFIKKVCMDNNLIYYLFGGTLLGAIRHKGFIPWDDDIDLLLPREDYTKLVEILKDHDKYRSLSFYNNDDYYYSFAKIVDVDTTVIETELNRPIKGYGVYVDIFPLDGLPQNNLKMDMHIEKVLICKKMLNLALNKNCPPSLHKLKSIAKYFVWKAATLIGWKKWLEIIELLSTKYDFNHCNKVTCIVAGYQKNEKYSKSIFHETIPVEFEGEEYSAPVGYKKYLTIKYGNYMKLPPMEKRITHHDFKAYSK